MNYRIIKLSFFLLLAIGALFLANSCSEKVTDNSGDVEIQISASIAGLSGTSQAEFFELTITGVSILEPIVQELVMVENLLVGSIVVPAGPDRKFVIVGYDAVGDTVYVGQTIADIDPNKVIDLKISMYPQIPMIKLSPLYIQKPMGAIIALKVRVYNLLDLNEIEVKVSNMSQTEEVLYVNYEDGVIINPGIDLFADLEVIYYDDPDVNIRVNHVNLDQAFVDDSGYAELATLYYQTYNQNPILVDTFKFTPTITYAIDNNRDTVEYDGLLNEITTAEMYYFEEKLIADWQMEWLGQDSTVVLDYSDNQLHGVAYGTTRGENNFGLVRFFDGEDDYIEVPDNDLLDMDSALTISCWINPDALFERGTVLSRRTENGEINYELWIEKGAQNDFYYFNFTYGSSLQTYRAEVSADVIEWWHHIVFSFEYGNPSSALFVIDLVEREGSWVSGSGREFPPLVEAPLYMGRSNSSAQSFFFGGLDRVALFNIALDLDVIRQNWMAQ